MSALVTGLLSLALVYRQGQVTFDIPPVRGELLALIAVTLWVAWGVLRPWRLSGSTAGRLEWTLGGGLVGLLLAPHVPSLALAVTVASLAVALVQVATDLSGALRTVREVMSRRPALILAILALGGFRAGGGGDWIGLAGLALAAGLVAVQCGFFLVRWSRGQAPFI